MSGYPPLAVNSELLSGHIHTGTEPGGQEGLGLLKPAPTRVLCSAPSAPLRLPGCQYVMCSCPVCPGGPASTARTWLHEQGTWHGTGSEGARAAGS